MGWRYVTIVGFSSEYHRPAKRRFLLVNVYKIIKKWYSEVHTELHNHNTKLTSVFSIQAMWSQQISTHSLIQLLVSHALNIHRQVPLVRWKLTDGHPYWPDTQFWRLEECNTISVANQRYISRVRTKTGMLLVLQPIINVMNQFWRLIRSVEALLQEWPDFGIWSKHKTTTINLYLKSKIED